MQLRYSFRLYPNGPQRAALARAFGCARVVCNDAFRARETARAAGEPFPKTGDLSKQIITGAKKTEERAWLGEVSAVVLQQSLRACGTVHDRDTNAAVNIAKAAGLAVTACGAQVRPEPLVPAQRSEAGTHRDGHPTVVGIPGL